MEEPHERKFLVNDISNIVDLVCDRHLKATGAYCINQIHIDEYKYRRIEDAKWQIEYMSYIRKDGKTILKPITEAQWHELEKSVDYRMISKVRFCFRDPEGWDYDIDCFMTPKFFCMIEIDGKGRDMYKFNPPEYFQEVTGNPKYSNKNIFNGSLG